MTVKKISILNTTLLGNTGTDIGGLAIYDVENILLNKVILKKNMGTISAIEIVYHSSFAYIIQMEN